MDNIEKKDQIVVDILPLTKWKRFLVYLADFFITFIFCFFLYNVAIMPLAKLVTSFNYKSEQSALSMKTMHKILYENKILFQSTQCGGENIEINIAYTYDIWLSYQTLDEVISPDETNQQYGHKEENEVIYNFYNDIRDDLDGYINLFDIYNNKSNYFVKEGGRYLLKNDIKNEVKYYFDPRSDMGSLGQEYYNNIKNKIFIPMLSEIFIDIETNDLLFDGSSYVENLKIHDSYVKYYDNLLISTAFFTLFLSWLIYYVVIPFIHRDHKTLAMMMMSIERVNIDKLYLCKRREMIFSSIYALFANMVMVFFLPITFVTFNYLFSLTALLTFALGSLLFNLVSLGFILFNNFNRSLSDIFSRSVMITTSNLDEIYKAKGYNI